MDASPTLSLLDALKRGGGDEKALGRHAVAALLNTSNAQVDYGLAGDQLINLVQAAYQSGDFETTRNLLESATRIVCRVQGTLWKPHR